MLAARHPYLDVDGPVAMAHRGFSRDGLENTMAAFAAAVRLGVTHVETDVHCTKDGVLVAFHDAVLDRVTDARGSLEDFTWADLASVRIGGAEVVPRLAELLDTWPDLRVNVDVKAWSAVTPTADVVRAAAAQHRVCLASFDDRRTAAVRRLLGPTVATAPGPRDVARWRLASWVPGAAGPRLARPRDPGAVAYQVPAGAGPLHVVTRRTVDVAHALGLQVHVWTVNDPDEMGRLLDLGVDGLISDRSDTLMEVLRGRGPAPA